eukprot:3180579-Prorocentrum_lima.AAC.1
MDGLQAGVRPPTVQVCHTSLATFALRAITSLTIVSCASTHGPGEALDLLGLGEIWQPITTEHYVTASPST